MLEAALVTVYVIAAMLAGLFGGASLGGALAQRADPRLSTRWPPLLTWAIGWWVLAGACIGAAVLVAQ